METTDKEEIMDEDELRRIRRRKARIQRMKKEKERRLRIQRLIKLLLPVIVIVLCVVVFLIVAGIKRNKVKHDEESVTKESVAIENDIPEVVSGGDVSENDLSMGMHMPTKELLTPVVSTKQYSAKETSKTAAPPAEVDSTNVIFIDLASGDIVSQRDCHTVVNPASMTKVLTLLVAAEHITDLDDLYTMTIDVTDYSYSHDCSSVGFAVGEQVTVRDLLYGTILPSGGDAAVGLATYVAGSHEAFVEMMNEKAKILGIDDTAHFTNCVGIYDKDHHCTPYDMAMIMEAALENDLCKEVLSAHTYTTSSTKEHPEGITVSNWFLRRIEDKDTGGEVMCAKTGFVAQSRNCAVSYGVDKQGNEYVCVTTGAHSSWRCIYDHVAIYKAYAKGTS